MTEFFALDELWPMLLLLLKLQSVTVLGEKNNFLVSLL